MIKTWKIYSIYNYKLDLHYIGRTSLSLAERVKIHFNALKRNDHRNKYLQHDFNTKNTILLYSILEDNLTKDEAKERERYWIKQYNSLFPKGYNIHDGDKVPELALKERASRKGENNPMFGIRKKGLDNPNNKFSLNDCQKTKTLLMAGLSMARTAKEVGMSIDIVKQIKYGKHWSNEYLGGSFKDWTKKEH